MTPADYTAFAEALDAFSGAWRKKLSGREVLAYRAVLDDLDLGLITRTLETLARQKSAFMPVAGAIRTAALAAQEPVARPDLARAHASVARGEYGCLQCLDTGWVYVAAGRMVSMDEAQERGLRHVRACPCRGHNTNYQAKEQASRVQRAHRSDSDRWGGRN